MKNLKSIKILLLAFVIASCFNQSVLADIAPDPDEMRVTADLTINTDEDVSDHRFFVNFSGALHEVEIKSKAQTVIPSLGGGARYSSGTLLAIPKKNLKDYPAKLESPYSEEGRKFSDAISGNKIQGIIELTGHSFSRVIKIRERGNWSYPTYKLQREGETLKIIKMQDVTPKLSLEEESRINSRKYIIIAGILITLAILGAGIFVFRKVLKKS